MQVITEVIGCREMIWGLRISKSLVEVENCIEVSYSSDPCIDRSAIRLIACRWIVVIRVGIRRDGSADHSKMGCMGSSDDLSIGGNYALNEGVVFGLWRIAQTCQSSDVIYSFKHDQPPDACLSKNITIEARESIGTKTVCEQMVATDSLIEDADVFGTNIGLKPP